MFQSCGSLGDTKEGCTAGWDISTTISHSFLRWNESNFDLHGGPGENRDRASLLKPILDCSGCHLA